MTRAKTSVVLAAIGLALVAAVLVYLRGRETGPAAGSAEYEQVVRAFYRGLAHLDVGLLDNADQAFVEATTIAPEEPASWANLGLTRLRLGSFETAAEPVAQAAALAPENAEVAFLQGRMAALGGQLDEGMAHLRRAVELDPDNLTARFALVEELGRSGAADADEQSQALLDEILVRAPDNLVVLLESARIAARRGDVEALRTIVARLGEGRDTWPESAAGQYDDLQEAVDAGDVVAAARANTFLRNVLAPSPAFQEGRAVVATAFELIAEPFDRFLTLPAPSATPSPADEGLTFVREPLEADPGAPATVVLAASLDGTGLPAVFAAAGADVRRIDMPEASAIAADTSGAARGAHVLALDWNHDFRTDLVTTGPGGLRLLIQGEDGAFTDATASAAGGDAPIAQDATGAWAVDLEMDGDLDIIAGVNGAPAVALRNNGDGTWRVQQPFGEPGGLRAFAWGDLDRDGDPDAALLGADGSLVVFLNRQGGRFERAPEGLQDVVAFTIADIDAAGGLDLVVFDASGSIRRASLAGDGWETAELAAWPQAPDGEAGSVRLFAADLDNNGALDLVASGMARTAVWLAGEGGTFQPLTTFADADVFGVTDLDGDGYLDLAALSEGRAIRLLGRGTQPYHWQLVRPRAQQVAGDQRINSFGVGGEIEIRAGLLTQKQLLTGGPVHFGLGAHEAIDVVRILWPNGVVQAEFDRAPDEALVAEQRLKGSCPWVFAYDGTGMRFVTDFLWRSPLGLRINAQDTAGITQTEDWIRIGGDQLVPRDGFYDVRITAELWETHYFDHVSLMAIDHPDTTEIFVDERFAPQPPALEARAVQELRPVGEVRDEQGRDVSELVAALDGRYLATFERGAYQGIAKDHYVEFDAPREGTAGRWLVGQGWVYPTDSSINVAVGQGRHEAPRGLSLEAQDEAGRWVVVAPDLGFPAGKNKTVLVDLQAVADAGIRSPRRLRLRTNLEVYWDRLAIADRADQAPIETTRVAAASADLGYRGFSRTNADRRDLPETPRYHEIANVTQRWRDLAGFYTRFGDVRELVDEVDDRYVIMNAGDELRLRFPALPDPPAGWRRDFVLVGDGWNKDGDYNTSYSQTVQPLPSHRDAVYEAPPAGLDLAHDPVYRRHQSDWERYHTRVVTPHAFLNGLQRR